ncbi:hypothetical protein PTSG_09472 [Salpingoeca rosetta]|uniref:Thioesterase n=1 Tax=Salpingoeca rosetta (strain ATCC 50818 / BSB-021) TaxID=946362 RepID=F2UL40_SALR5|nr:uncharacterized protein PTSG_09472 [Salpingoeca rosetta]EGD77839.1 hypothetical protein PTSG_09472 [Salpingoeca rosetta]|eukprot:XP_004989903.1 hypothetical protein PTSG_09472 [Salpingoeca rosetta]
MTMMTMMMMNAGCVLRRATATPKMMAMALNASRSAARGSVSQVCRRGMAYTAPFHEDCKPPSFVPEELAKQYPVWHTEVVQWGDMDAFQHVNNVVYFRYFENARIKFLHKLCDFAKTDFVGTHAVGPIMADAYTRFKAPLTFPDTLSLGIRVDEVERDELQLVYQLVSEKLKGTVAAEGRGRLVSFDYRTGAKADFPPAMVEAMVWLQPDEPSLQALINNNLE